jgi:hypothetical protein
MIAASAADFLLCLPGIAERKQGGKKIRARDDLMRFILEKENLSYQSPL